MILKGSDNDDRWPNGPIDINASGGDGSHVDLGWCDKLVDGDNYDTQEARGKRTVQQIEMKLGSVDAKEPCSDKNLDNLGKIVDVDSVVENEAESKGLSSGEDTDYLDSSDVGGYETDSDGDFISKNIAKVHQQEDQASPPMSTPLVTPMPRQATPPMSRQTTPPMTFMSTPPAHSISTFDLGSPSAQPPIQSRSSTPTKRNVTTHRIPVCNR
ncbi:hypothetical protein V6N11_059556 [Hibiscus sabdariffa]|uniref:Uncharacterized protein n=1 Tax=Hibiscus sabdariffa TaxID=183260 RepID=A0ABR2NPN4_9ROSI